MKKLFLVILVVSFGFSQKNKKEIIFNNDEDIQEYLEMFNKSFDILKTHYVDSVNESEMIKEGIKGMMKKMDPYTKLLEGSSKESYDILKRGRYGGVGIQMGLRRDTLTVLAPMEDSPAYSEGIHSGDQIIMVDSTSTIGMTTSDAAKIIKGKIGTDVTLTILRPSTKQKIDFILKRDNITVKHIPYWGIDENGVGYIRITKFSKNVAKDFKKALIELDDANIKGLVLDLRGNSGGLLSASTNILDYLCERGEILLTQKGKVNNANREWKSRRKPILDIDIPIVVLINRSSASASEIVSGTLQDLDRAVILGQRSFGKGLVQHLYELNDTTTLKVTKGKYYLPSGRLIQKEDYLNNGFLTDGLDVKDSLFVTKTGRVVKGGGGITPDIKTKIESKPSYINALWKEGVFLSFAATYVPFHNDLSVPLSIDSKIMDAFKKYLNEYDINFNIPGEKEFYKFKKKIKSSSISINPYSKNISRSNENIFLDDMENYFEQVKLVQFSLPENQKWIKNGLLREMSRVISGEKERLRVSLYEDSDYNHAVELILDLQQYDSILGL